MSCFTQSVNLKELSPTPWAVAVVLAAQSLGQAEKGRGRLYYFLFGHRIQLIEQDASRPKGIKHLSLSASVRL